MNEHDFERHPIYCPVCGAENPNRLFKLRTWGFEDDEWFGCDGCLWDNLEGIDIDELEDDDIEALSEE